LLWRSVFRSVLALYPRRKLLTLAEAKKTMDEALGLMSDQEYEVTSAHVLRLVAVSPCSEYDCEFVAPAHDLDVPLVTVDQQILEHYPAIAVSLESFFAS
jgi:predicted nucleic acid-binding protein